MQYGYFDLEHKEYVITRPDTPAPWANYLGSPEYGAIVSNNGGGYSFVKSGANGRIIRYRFNSNIGLPGRYIYIRDNDAKDYWSCTWQPVGKPLDQYKTECHHGTAYTTIKSDYADIHSELTYYVPLNKTYEVWRTKITNNSDRYRNLSTFGFVEFTNENNYEQDQVNLQYTLFITRTSLALLFPLITVIWTALSALTEHTATLLQLKEASAITSSTITQTLAVLSSLTLSLLLAKQRR